MLAELRVIFPLEISLVSGVSGQAGTGLAVAESSSRSTMLWRSQHRLYHPSLSPYLPSITAGPFPAVPRSQDTDILGHFVLSPQLSSCISSTTPATSTVASPTLILGSSSSTEVMYTRGLRVLCIHRGTKTDRAHSRPSAAGYPQDSMGVEGQGVSLQGSNSEEQLPLLFGFCG